MIGIVGKAPPIWLRWSLPAHFAVTSISLDELGNVTAWEAKSIHDRYHPLGSQSPVFVPNAAAAYQMCLAGGFHAGVSWAEWVARYGEAATS